MNKSDKGVFNIDWRALFGKKSQRFHLEDFPSPQSIDYTLIKDTRIVVIDLETTGLNIHKDQVIAIGAVVVQHNEIKLNDQFEQTVFRKLANVEKTVLIHGISPEEIAQGKPPESVLPEFMHFAGECIFLAYHAPFDHGMLSRALKRDVGLPLKHTFIDVADIAAALFPAAEVGRSKHNVGLDDWVDYFRLNVSSRHNAAADAMVTAEITLILLREAERQAIDTLAQLAEKIKAYKRLRIMKQ